MQSHPEFVEGSQLFDTHCHFDSLEDAITQLPKAYEAGVRAINIIGCDVETTLRSIEVVKMIDSRREELGLHDLDAKATIGLHPHETSHLNEQRDVLENLHIEHPELICGVGETGFDFFYEHSSKPEQREAFLWQIELAKSWEKAMVIHTRDAWDDTFALLDEAGWPKKSVLHCFTGGPEQALKSVDNGAYISISGIVTFKNAQEIRDAIEVVPLDKLICETDAPWLAPVPHRGKENEPGYVSLVAQAIAQIREEKCGDEPADVYSALFENGKKVFR